MNAPKGRGLLYVAENAKVLVPLPDYTGVVAWIDNKACVYNELGIEIVCWSLEGLVKCGLIEEGAFVTKKVEIKALLNKIVEKIQDRVKAN